jgi:Shedu protein SduA, C-terminal
MASYVPPPDPEGTLVVENKSPTTTEVYFIPDEDRLSAAGIDPTDGQSHRVRMLTFDSEKRSITIEPKNTILRHTDFLKPKYNQIERIRIRETGSLFASDDPLPETVEDVIEALSNFPSAFTKNPDFGLGLAKDYRFIIDAVEKLSECTVLDITNEGETRIDPDAGVFYISECDFDDLRRSINSITSLGQNAARSVKAATAYNKLAEKVGASTIEVNAGRHPVRRMITSKAMGEEVLKEDEQDTMIQMLSQSAKAMGKTQTDKLAKLQSDIELVTLDALIDSFEEMLDKKLAENRWQDFFNENPFILNMAFGYPVIKVKDQASVGGRKLSGGGDKITDFLVKNSLTNNTALFEIKTPQTEVLNKRPFREGVYIPSGDLAGSINQALDQKYQFQKQIAAIKDNTRVYDIESYAVHCCLIIGKTPKGNDQQKSFEMFRRNSKDVEIVTFDELLEKLRQLRLFLAENEGNNLNSIKPERPA